MSEQPAISPMRIAILIERYLPASGGAERSASQIAERLADRGHAVTVLAACGEADDRPGLTLEAMSDSRSLSPLRLRRLRQWATQRLEAGSFDVSLSMTTSLPGRFIQPRAGLVRELQARAIARRDSWAARQSKRLRLALTAKQVLLRRYEDQTLRDPAVHRFIAISDYMAEQLRQTPGLDPAMVCTIRNGAQLPTLDDAQRADARVLLGKTLGLAADDTVFLFAANDLQRKGIVPLLRALRRLEERGVRADVLVVGGYTFKLNRLAAELGVRDRVRWLGASQHMAELYAAADATVLPTYYDPSSKVVIESLLTGTPAITTAFNGASDFVRNPRGEDRGIVLDDPDDVDALADAMAAMCDPARRAACRAAIAPIAYELTMDRHVDQLERLFAESLGG